MEISRYFLFKNILHLQEPFVIFGLSDNVAHELSGLKLCLEIQAIFLSKIPNLIFQAAIFYTPWV
jgi:hypothetical protein